MEHLLNSRSNQKHSRLEELIRRSDPAQEMSRSGIFQRAVRAAVGVQDWPAVQDSLAGLKEQEGGRVVTSFQARYDDATAQLLDEVRGEMLRQLQKAGRLKVLQTQYMVLLLLANYLRKLKEAQELALKADGMAEGGDISHPDIVKFLVEMILQEPECSELTDIRNILLRWKGRRHVHVDIGSDYDWREQIIAFHTDDPIERHFIYQAAAIAEEGPENTRDPEVYQAARRLCLQQTLRDKTFGIKANRSPRLQALLAPLFGKDANFDTANSVNTTVNQMFLSSKKSLGIDGLVSKRKLVKAYVDNRPALDAAIQRHPQKCLCEFLRAAYTMGNFIVSPAGCNVPRGSGLTKDYFDLALWCIRSYYLAHGDGDIYLKILLSGKRYDAQPESEYLREREILVQKYSSWLNSFGSGPEGWLAFADKNLLAPFLLEDSSPRPLWARHIETFEVLAAKAMNNGTLGYEALDPLLDLAAGLLPREGQIAEYFTNAARAIQERGRLMLDALSGVSASHRTTV